MNSQPAEWRFGDISIGYTTEPITCSFSARDVDVFAALSGDYNPLHTDNSFAERKGYPERVVHGMLSASKFSYLVGMVLPGKHCLYVAQDIRFHKPVFAGQPYTLRGTVVSKSVSTRLLEIRTELFDANGALVVGGVAQVKVV